MKWLRGASCWTVSAGGIANSSSEFLRLQGEIERLIRSEANALIAGRADVVAGLILAQLAHVHGMAPSKPSFPGDPDEHNDRMEAARAVAENEFGDPEIAERIVGAYLHGGGS